MRCRAHATRIASIALRLLFLGWCGVGCRLLPNGCSPVLSSPCYPPSVSIMGMASLRTWYCRIQPQTARGSTVIEGQDDEGGMGGATADHRRQAGAASHPNMKRCVPVPPLRRTATALVSPPTFIRTCVRWLVMSGHSCCPRHPHPHPLVPPRTGIRTNVLPV